MTYPVDEMTNLTKANGQLFTALADIGRAGAQDYFDLSRKLIDAYAVRLKDAQPGGGQGFDSGPLTAFLTDLEKRRTDALVKAKGAFEAWQAAASALVPDDGTRKQLTEAVQGWMKPVLDAQAEVLKSATVQAEKAQVPPVNAAPSQPEAAEPEPAKPVEVQPEQVKTEKAPSKPLTAAN